MLDEETVLPVAGSCHGFAVRTSLPFVGLRHAHPTGFGLTVRPRRPKPAGTARLLQTWDARHGRLAISLFQTTPSSYLVRTGSLGDFDVSVEPPSIGVPAGDIARQELLTFGTPVALCIEAAGAIPLHAAAVEAYGQGIVITGRGGAGKTTLSAAFHAAGHRALSDDLSRCDVGPQGATVAPGPALVRLRDDVAGQLRLSGASAVAALGGKTHFAIDPDRRGSGQPVPLAAVAFLEETEDEHPSVTSVEPQAAIASLWPAVFFLPTPEGRAACFRRLTDLVSSVPLFRLRRPRDVGRLPRVVELLCERVLAR